MTDDPGSKLEPEQCLAYLRRREEHWELSHCDAEDVTHFGQIDQVVKQLGGTDGREGLKRMIAINNYATIVSNRY